MSLPPDDWIPLHQALAWIVTRDSKFMHAIQTERIRPRETNMDRMRRLLSKSADETDEQLSRAWTELRKTVGDGTVRIRAEPFDNRSGKWANPSEGEPCASDHADASQPARSEFDNEFSDQDGDNVVEPEWFDDKKQLVLEHTKFRIWLRPLHWFSTGGTWWRNVEVSHSDLVTSFRPIVRRRKKSARELAFREAIEALWPDGKVPPLMSQERQCKAARDWLKAQGVAISSAMNQYSQKTFNRAFEKWKAAHKGRSGS